VVIRFPLPGPTFNFSNATGHPVSAGEAGQRKTKIFAFRKTGIKTIK